MKKIFSIFISAASAIALTSCIGDLDTLPLNETDATSETAYSDEASYLKGLAYINAYYSFVSQNDPNDMDISVGNAGQSELLRMYVNLNEMSCDALKCIWGDAFISDLQNNSWTSAESDATVAVYTRCMKGITLANEYLLQTTDEKLQARGHSDFADKIAGYRAEARFHRALFYYLLMDLFGNPPFATEENIGGANPSQIGRANLFKWIESECNDLLAGDMPAKGEVPYPRPTKGSVQALLARMYLNAEVYTGTAMWSQAKAAAQAVIDMGYKIHPNYEELFMQDNSTNGAAEEFIFAVEYDKDHAQSWGFSTTMVSAALDESGNKKIASLLGLAAPTVSAENWDGYHVADDYVARFSLVGVEWGGDGFGYDRQASDKRAFFYNGGCEKTFSLDNSNTGWRCWKFTSRFSDGTAITSDVDNYKYSSADFGVFRLAEMYLIYAEADARMNGGSVSDKKAVGYIKELRDRAGVSTPIEDDMTLDWILDERARELMWEGHRRTDLIRYGYFTSMNFPWAFKGGVENGKVAIPDFRKVFPILVSDINANPNLKQNEGY